VRAFQANPPKRLAQQFIALPAMEFVKEIFEITGGRLLIPLQSKQPRDFVVVEFVHLVLRRYETGFFRNSSR